MFSRLLSIARVPVPAAASRPLRFVCRRSVSTLSSHKVASSFRPLAAAAAVSAVSRAEYKVNCGDVKVGHIVEVDGKLYQVVGTQLSQAAMRKSSMSLDIKDIKTGAKSPFRCKPSDKIERVEPERKTFTYLYRSGDILYLMDPQSFEQIEVDASVLADAREAAYLRENQPLSVEYNGEKMLRVILPQYVVVQVKSCDGSGGAGLKPAELVNGRHVKVSQHIVPGDWVRIQTSDETFMDKAPAPTE